MNRAPFKPELIFLISGLLAIATALVLSISGSSVLPAQIDPVAKSRTILNNQEKRLERFQRELEDLRKRLKIPGMSAAMVKDQRLFWAKGFGLADYERQIAATEDTPYRIASLTKTFTSTLIMQLVEQGKLDLDEPMKRYSNDFKDDAVKVRHVLTHTSEGTPGESYRYNGNRFAQLTAVIEKRSGKRFRELLAVDILEKLNMSGSVPGQDVLNEADQLANGLGRKTLQRYEEVLKRLAKPYRLYGANQILLSAYPPKGISASAGLISTVVDLAKYDVAIDQHVLLKKETQEKVFTPAVSNAGKTLPYGLGWFVQNYQGLKLVWHYGLWPTFSALILKVPEKDLTLILLANSAGLSAPFSGLGAAGDVMSSAFACAFMRRFAFEDLYGQILPQPNWQLSPKELSAEIAGLEKQTQGYKYNCELRAHASMLEWLASRQRATPPPAHKEIKVDPEIYDAYVGQYQFDNGLIITLTKEGDQLIVQPGGEEKLELFPESTTKFFLEALDVQITFVKNAQGQATHLIVRGDGPDVRARKVK